MIYHDLTEKVLGVCFEVSNELGCGFIESVYEKSLMIAFGQCGLKAQSQVPLKVIFRNQVVGEFYSDLIIEDKVLIELKAVKALVPEHLAQVMNYLKATRIEVGLLVNFGTPKLEFRRFGNRLL